MQSLPSAHELATRVMPGPRYTSYPPATAFTPAVGPGSAAAALARVAERDGRLGLYAHVPFCQSLCWYCGCNVVVTRDKSRGAAYVDLLLAELDLVIAQMGRRPVHALSLGGGSPNFLEPEDLVRVVDGIDRRLGFASGAELHIELDPRTTTATQIAWLAAAGFTRVSIGVQDFSPEVQKAIHREQSAEQTAELVRAARRAGMASINFDLIYGLPLQTPERFDATLSQVLAMEPDRTAVFGYAHLPDMRPAQRLVARAGAMPGPVERAELFLTALERFTAAGYVHVGLDHFARPDDELARALADGTLDRNFQGYVASRADLLVGLGSSAISDLGDVYWQNHTPVDAWSESVAAGELPVARGVTLVEEDRLRRYVISRLLCDRVVAADDVERRFGIDFSSHFADELRRLEGADGAGLVTWDPQGGRLAATDGGALLLRNVALVFDQHRLQSTAERPRNSPTL
jgi:oxygen-independent coproporphyrinogen-3 oxidase